MLDVTSPVAISYSLLLYSIRNAGFVFGAGNTCATLAGLLSVPLNGLILDTTENGWGFVFGLMAVHYVGGAVLWAMWVGDRQLKEDIV